MSKTVAQIFVTNPVTTIADTDLIYLVNSPYTPGTDAAILGSNFRSSITSGAVLLSPSTDQTITAHNLNLALGLFSSGSAAGGITGAFQAHSPTANQGSFIFQATNAGAGNFAMRITNATFVGQPCIITVPDPVANTSTFLLSTAGANQHITAFSLQVDVGALIVGQTTGGANNGLILYSPTASNGNINILAADNGANSSIVITNAAFGQASTLTIPDPGASTANFLLDTSASNKTINYRLTMPSIAFSSTSGIIGTTTNNNAAALSVGEYISSTLTFGTPTSLTGDTAKDITSISLTAGDWDVWGFVGFLGNSATLFQYGIGWISSTSATLVTRDNYLVQTYSATGVAVFASSDVQLNTQKYRISLASTTTFFLSCQAGFTVNTCSAYGNIKARRIR